MKNKKKILAIVLMGLLVLTLVPAAVFAGYGSQQGQGIGYVDANGDGICDNHGSACGNYVDANGDGVCDNAGTVNTGQHGGRGMGHHGGGHHGGRW